MDKDTIIKAINAGFTKDEIVAFFGSFENPAPTPDPTPASSPDPEPQGMTKDEFSSMFQSEFKKAMQAYNVQNTGGGVAKQKSADDVIRELLGGESK